MGRVTNKEIMSLKREVKALTGMKLKDIEMIGSYGDDFITYGYYESNYDRVTNKMTFKEIERAR